MQSSLLNILSGRQATRGKVVVSSTMVVGDKKVDPKAFRKRGLGFHRRLHPTATLPRRHTVTTHHCFATPPPHQTWPT